MAQHRGFQDEFYHDEYIVEEWNKVVGKRDLVYILGDITMESVASYPILDRLNGRKKVILGNHDMAKDIPELLTYVETVSGPTKYKGWILTHIPIAIEELHFWRGNIYGHVHENTHVPSNDKRINVSAEMIGYKPKTLDELKGEESS